MIDGGPTVQSQSTSGLICVKIRAGDCIRGVYGGDGVRPMDHVQEDACECVTRGGFWPSQTRLVGPLLVLQIIFLFKVFIIWI